MLAARVEQKNGTYLNNIQRDRQSSPSPTPVAVFGICPDRHSQPPLAQTYATDSAPLRGFFVWHRVRANSAERGAPLGYEQALVDARVQSRALATSNESRTRLAKLVPWLLTMQGRQNAEMAQRLYDFIMGSGLPAAGRRNVGAGRAQSAAQFCPG